MSSPPRPTRIMVCNNNHADDEHSTTTVVEYSTAVQIVSSFVSKEHLEITIPRWVSGATVDAVAQFLCGQATTEEYYDSDNSDNEYHRLLLPSSLSSCILSVSVGHADVFVDHQCGVAHYSHTCARYNGDLKIVHVCHNAEDDIQEAVHDILAELHHDRDFCLNLLAYTNHGGQVELGRVVFGDKLYVDDNNNKEDDYGAAAAGGGTASSGSGTGYDDTNDYSDKDPVVTATITEASESSASGLNAGGVALLAAMGALAALAALLLLWWLKRRFCRNNNNNDDGKSIHTNWSDPTALDNQSYLKPDFHDLGLQHSTADVHRCVSAFCEVCRPNLGQVHLLPVGKLDLTGMQVQADEAAAAAEQQEDEEEDDDYDNDLDENTNDDLVLDGTYSVNHDDDEDDGAQARGGVSVGGKPQDNHSDGQTSLGAILDADAPNQPPPQGQAQQDALYPTDNASFQGEDDSLTTSYVQEDPDGYAFVRTERHHNEATAARLNDFQKTPRRRTFGRRGIFGGKPSAASDENDDNVPSVLL